MATDLNQLLTTIAGLTGADKSSQDYAAQNQQIQSNDQILQINRLKMAAQQQKQAEDQQFQQDAADYSQNPTVPKLAAMLFRYSDKAAAIKAGHDALSEPAQRGRLGQLSELYYGAKNNNPTLLAKKLGDIITAEKGQGNDTSEAEELQADLAAGSPDAVNHVLAYAQAHLAIADPTFAKDIGAVGGEKYASAGEGTVFNTSTGEIKGTPREKPSYQKVDVLDATGKKVGERIVQFGGDGGSGAAPGGGSGTPAASSGRTTGGWTPRARNGGDNTDAAVDSKISGASQFLGVGPEDDITQITPTKIAQALALSEGGAGSLADRNNNPANMRRRDGTYMKFVSPQAGLNAAAGLVQRKIANGQTTLRTLIEGLPVGGSGTAGNAPAAGGGTTAGGRVVYDSTIGQPAGASATPGDTTKTGAEYLATVEPGLRNRAQGIIDARLAYPTSQSAKSPQVQALLNVIAQAAPGFDQAAWLRKKKTIEEYTPGGKTGQQLVSAATVINHMYDLMIAAQNLPDHNFKWMNSISNTAADQTNQKWLIDYNEGRKFISSELPKFLEGKAPAEGQINQHYESYNPNKGKSGIQSALSTDLDYMIGKFEPLVQAYKDQTGKDLNIDSFAPGAGTRAKIAALEHFKETGELAPIGSARAASAKATPAASAAATTGAPASRASLPHVATMAQANALPPNVQFIDPHGVPRWSRGSTPQ